MIHGLIRKIGAGPRVLPTSRWARIHANGGIMFVTTPDDRVIAVDAHTGDRLWRRDRDMQVPQGGVVWVFALRGRESAR